MDGLASATTLSPTGLAAVAVVCSIFRHAFFSQKAELSSELLAWILLPILFKTTRSLTSKVEQSLDGGQRQSMSTISLWLYAFGIASVSLATAEYGVMEFMPLTVPALLAVQNHLRPDIPLPGTAHPETFSPLVATVWGTTLVAVVSSLTLAQGDYRGCGIATLVIGLLLLLCRLALPANSAAIRPWIIIGDISEAITPLARRTSFLLLVCLGAQSIYGGILIDTIGSILLQGLIKTCFWYFVLQLAIESSWYIVPATVNFGIMTTQFLLLQTSDLQVFSQLISCFLCLAQVMIIVPKSVQTRPVLWAFMLIPSFLFISDMSQLSRTVSAARSSFSHSSAHPIEALAASAALDFETLTNRQSKSYSAARKEYQRRYRVDPPPGFNAWYNYAASHQSPIIDDFDIINDVIAPFLTLSGTEILARMKAVQEAPDNEVWTCSISQQMRKTQCTHANRSFDRHIRLLFDRLLEDSAVKIPALKFLVNHLDEPRVLVPSSSMDAENSFANGIYNQTNLSHQSTWDAITKYCGSKGNSEKKMNTDMVETYELPFVTNVFESKDLCRHVEYSFMHGLTMSPVSFRLFEGLVPILASGAPSTMGDILYPSPAYLEEEFQYDESSDVDWDEKYNRLYWRGSTSGAYAMDYQWRHYQRQRFVAMTQSLGHQRYRYLREEDGVISHEESSFLNGRSFDVAFTKIFQCQHKYCRDQKMFFDVKPWAHKDQAFKSRLAFDIDGNGISGRYYKLLASKSVPLKQGLFREWHDNRLIPWVHYIPVSQGMEELPELVSYLTSNERGQKLAKKIADQGRDWSFKSLRKVDMSIYLYRLMLELARLQDPNRPAMPQT